MDSLKLSEGVRDRITSEMIAADRSKRSLAIEAGIPLTTLDRKLRTGENITVNDIAKIARALHVPFTHLLPREVLDQQEGRAA